MSRGEFPTATKRLIATRSAGCCEVCGRQVIDPDTFEPLAPHSFQHRRARGMGGSRTAATRSAANGLLACGSGVTGCHGRMESNPHEAKAKGWAVSHWADPETTPADLFLVGWVILTTDGGYEHADPHQVSCVDCGATYLTALGTARQAVAAHECEVHRV